MERRREKIWQAEKRENNGGDLIFLALINGIWFREGGQILEGIAGPTAQGTANVDDVIETGNGEQNTNYEENPTVDIWKEKQKMFENIVKIKYG
jgi:hypothetical protein